MADERIDSTFLSAPYLLIASKFCLFKAIFFCDFINSLKISTSGLSSFFPPVRFSNLEVLLNLEFLFPPSIIFQNVDV